MSKPAVRSWGWYNTNSSRTEHGHMVHRRPLLCLRLSNRLCGWVYQPWIWNEWCHWSSQPEEEENVSFSRQNKNDLSLRDLNINGILDKPALPSQASFHRCVTVLWSQRSGCCEQSFWKQQQVTGEAWRAFIHQSLESIQKVQSKVCWASSSRLIWLLINARSNKMFPHECSWSPLRLDISVPVSELNYLWAACSREKSLQEALNLLHKSLTSVCFRGFKLKMLRH